MRETREQVLERIKGIRVTFSDTTEEILEQEYGTRWFTSNGETYGTDEITLIDEHGNPNNFYANGPEWSIVPYINFEDELLNL
jgi:hypothetical protein